MNWDHINATFAGARLYRAGCQGQRIYSDGSAAFPGSKEFAPKSEGTEQPKLGELWESSLALPVSPVVVGDCRLQGGFHVRQVGERFVQERYFRCFGNTAGDTWTATPAGHLLVHHKGTLVAAVMPLDIKSSDGAVCNLTDEEVFGPYANDDNGWYLIDAKTINQKIAAAEERIEKCNDEIGEWEAERDGLREEIKSLKLRLSDPTKADSLMPDTPETTRSTR